MSHCLNCWDAPSVVLTLVFSQFQVLLSLVGIKKKERRKERKKELKEKNDNKRELLKKQTNKSLLLASNWPSQFCWSSWLQQAEGGLASLFSPQCLSSLQPSSPAALGAAGSGTHPPLGYGCKHRAFSGAHSPWCVGCGLGAPPTLAGASRNWVERRLELLLQENSPNCR